MLFLPPSDIIRLAFAKRCAGYLSASQVELEAMLRDLAPMGYSSVRELGVLSAIEWMIRHPVETARLRRRLKFERGPFVPGREISARAA